MKGYIYILQCSDNSYYTGSTNNLELRLAQHKSGEGANYTKKRLPVKLVFSQEFERVDEAFYAEKQVQGWSRKKKQALIEGRFEDLPKLAECQNESHCGNKPALPFPSTSLRINCSAQGPATISQDLKNSLALKEKIRCTSFDNPQQEIATLNYLQQEVAPPNNPQQKVAPPERSRRESGERSNNKSTKRPKKENS